MGCSNKPASNNGGFVSAGVNLLTKIAKSGKALPLIVAAHGHHEAVAL